MTAKLKKGKYIYYHCTGKRGGNCKKDYIREEKIDKLITALIDKIAHAIPEDIYPKAVKAVKEMNTMGMDYSGNSYDAIVKRLKTLDKRLNKLYEDKSDGVITKEFW